MFDKTFALIPNKIQKEELTYILSEDVKGSRENGDI